MVFKHRKIETQKTVGRRLKEARRKKKLTIEKVEEATKVRAKYLEAIESDRWKQFPSFVYILGFVRRYSDFLGLDSREITDEFKREFGSTRRIYPLKSPKEKLTANRLIITPRLVLAIVAIAVVALVVGYIVYSVEKFSRAPQLEVTFPKTEVVEQKDIVIEGNTLSTAIVEINNQLVSVDDAGHFSQAVELTPGVNFYEIRSKSRLGKETTKVLKILYEVNQ